MNNASIQNPDLKAPESQAGNKPNLDRGLPPRFFRLLVSFTVILYLLALVAEMGLRVAFPWDLLDWPESPFLTDMMKLSHHLPIYSAPANLNSFVYSPGLEYLTFALLKPFDLALDIRCCRLVSVAVGMLAAAVGVLPMRRLVQSLISPAPPKSFWLVSWGALWLVLSTNFLSDTPHPDNIHALLALTVFWLCFTAVETGRFGWALMTMGVAGLGVFTKQTGAVCFLGPALVFALLNPWGWRRWCVLVMLGVAVLGISLYLLWLPEYGRFFTLDLLSHQPIHTYKLLDIIHWLFASRRGMLACLAAMAVLGLWHVNGSCRRYLICWCSVGFFAVTPNTLAYIKAMGATNNLCLFEIWMFLLAWPFLVALPGLSLAGGGGAIREGLPPAWKQRAIKTVLLLCMGGYILALMPLKPVPSDAEYKHCLHIEANLHRDLQAGRKVLVPEGASYLIHCGITQPPLDRSNSALEIRYGNRLELLSEMKARIAAHYYDRIYLMWGEWYGTNMLGEIDRSYVADSNYIVEPATPKNWKHLGIFDLKGALMYNSAKSDCKVLSPR